MRRRGTLGAITATIVVLALSACGSSDEEDGSDGSDDSSAGSSNSSLAIVVSPGDGAETAAYDLTCDPAGGDHPQPQQACDALAGAGADVFDPVAPDQSCTMIFGGPQTATITGTYDGQKVDASFSRSDGCEIERWEKLGTTVFNLPLQ